MTRVSPRKARRFFKAKRIFTMGPVQLASLIRRHDDINIIDMRTYHDYAVGHVLGARNLPRERWHTYAGLSKDKVNIIYCYSEACRMAADGASDFAAHGYPVIELEGGFESWLFYNLPVDSLHKKPVPAAKAASQIQDEKRIPHKVGA